MIGSLELVLGVCAVVSALLAAWFHVPRVPALDAERWFKTVLATLLRGRCEQQEDAAEDWAARVVREVPYHPAGRFPERKVANPETWVPTGAFVEGEQALLERLRAVPDQPARWRSMYLEDEMGLSARLNDPAELGEAYAFDAMLGGVDGWTSLARVGAGDPTALTQLVERVGAHWVLVRGREDVGFPSVLDALSAQVARDVHMVPHDPEQDGLPNALLDSLQGEAAVVFVAEDVGALRMLRSLAERPALRDRVEAVLVVSAPLKGIEGHPLFEASAMTDWMGAWFGHDTLDTDRVWPTPYLSMQWVDIRETPPGLKGLPLQDARFPTPRSGPLQMVEVLDLGPMLVTSHPPVELVAASLLAVTSGFVLTRRAGAGGST